MDDSVRKSELQPSPSSGRNLTDASLQYERDKTDASLQTARRKTEAHIDSGLTNQRVSADETVQTLRDESDDLLQAARSVPGYDLATEQRDSDLRIENERHHSDSALEAERGLVDIATARERDMNNTLESKLLSSERVKTDKNLNAERIEIDSAYKGAVESLTTRDEFLAIVSHDLRNPLGAISSCASMLLEDFEHPMEVRKWIEFMQRNVDSSLRMISDLLDVERISENKMDFRFSSQPISRIIRDACDTFFLAAKMKDIDFKTKFCDEQIQTNCDCDRITQVLFNLLSNAMKFTPAHGKVLVEVQSDGKAVTITVRDTGCGMPKEKLATIFDRYAQLPSKDRTGLGLGLYIAKKITEAHGSNLIVDSTEQKGTAISFELAVVG